ncbi:hypothetical protein [Mesorhizobium sp. CO1-1-8]|uniref:hypothetical protein n=1 Tax=Mesorhizobium sp. CO1-1-8 TaxID=2876631 RepID=UPI001CD0BF2F|nr:hypothetical protein [Mesorhizobium sp. CO1-1-8]MBZ9775007.1 hypothetical protein [Mesorhizobium sp. CO1-1-8]
MAIEEYFGQYLASDPHALDGPAPVQRAVASALVSIIDPFSKAPANTVFVRATPPPVVKNLSIPFRFSIGVY